MNKEYINIQTNEKLVLEKVEHLASNSMLKHRIDLFNEWDFEKNKELGLDIWKVTQGSGKKAWWICDEGHKWDSVIGSRTKGCNCPYCAGQKVDKEKSLAKVKPEIASQWHPTKNGDLTPYDVTHNSGLKVWWMCRCGHEYTTDIASKSEKCMKCSRVGFTLKLGINDMWTTNPELASLLANAEDGYMYSDCSGQCVDWKCPDCGEIIKDKKISKVKHRGLKCNICSDGMSFPEKIMFNLLNELNIKFTHDKSTDFSDGLRYDFILNNNIYVEIHGGQHYKKCSRGRSLEKEKENDIIKKALALNNGAEHYIVIDARKSDFSFIKNNILHSNLSKIIDLTSIDWDIINKKSQSSILYDIVDLWNKGLAIKEISLRIAKDRNTVTKFLKIASELTICNYSEQESHKRSGKLKKSINNKKVVQLDNNQNVIMIFDSIAEAYKNTGINRSCIINVCKGKRITAGGYNWKYSE